MDHRQYLSWMFKEFRTIFWGRHTTTRQFAVITIEQLESMPSPLPDPEDLPLAHPDDGGWNAAFFDETIPTHTEPAILVHLESMIMAYLHQYNRLPPNIYLFTVNIPCLGCTQLIESIIEHRVPDRIRERIEHHAPQFLGVLKKLKDMKYHIGWNIEQGSEGHIRATIDAFVDANDDFEMAGVRIYRKVLLN